MSRTRWHDGIALRVVFEAKKVDKNERREITRAREAVLCYYIQNVTDYEKVDA